MESFLTVKELADIIKVKVSTVYFWTHTYTSEARSGADSDRPELNRLFEDTRKRKFRVVLFWSLDRFSREGVVKTILRLSEACGVRFLSYTEPYLSSLGPFRDAIVGFLASLARQKRVRLSERVRAGLQRAKAQGKKLGRPAVSLDEDEVLRLHKDDTSLRKMATSREHQRRRSGQSLKRRNLAVLQTSKIRG